MISREIAKFLGKFGIGITSGPNLTSLYEAQQELIFTESKLSVFQEFYKKNPTKFSKFFSFDLSFLELIQSSKSQLGQDLIALAVAGFKRDGYFVEFGATNGISNSNTHLLEKKFGWEGILCEPALFWQDSLIRNRNVHIDFDCVWTKSGEGISFNETKNKELSTLSHFSDSDMHSINRKNGKKYKVTSISLNDLLSKYDAPFDIDYLSIDTEGSEFDILNSFDFSKHSIKFISCEHNFGSNRERIRELLSNSGYEPIYQDISQFDDWFIQKELIKTEGLI